ncbi:spore coat protein U domain-containing protein [Pragia fontium]|uniref:Csu type fimbrial protein n=1 Tax=Pragia fontium TaxID=82985 RepID=UPI00069C8FFB|nr:spore coat protein U domain-containing protein [Pragia fontium]
MIKNKTAIHITIRLVKTSIILFLLFRTLAVEAACSVAATPNPINFGTVSSFTVYNTNQKTLGPGGLSCNRLAIQVLPSDYLIATLTSDNQLYLVNEQNSSAKIPYTVYADKDYKYPYPLGTPFNFSTSIPGVNLLSLLGVSLGFSTTLYVMTSVNANVPAGVYSDYIHVNWNYGICTSLICIPPLTGIDKGNATSTIKVTLTVTKDCMISSTPDVNFQGQALVEQFTSVNNNIMLTCTLQTPFKAYFSNGSNYSAPWRQMKKTTTTDMLQYNIYYPNTTTVWGNTAPATNSGTGTGVTQSLSYTATINPNQPEKPAGSYTDTIMFTLEY